MSVAKRSLKAWQPNDEITADRLQMMQVLAEHAQLTAGGPNVRLTQAPLGGTTISVDEPPPDGGFWIRLGSEDPARPGAWSWDRMVIENGVMVPDILYTSHYAGAPYIYTARASNVVGGVPYERYFARYSGQDVNDNPVYTFACDSDFGGYFQVTATTAHPLFPGNGWEYTMEEFASYDQTTALTWIGGAPRSITAYNYREYNNPTSGTLGMGVVTTDFDPGEPFDGLTLKLAPVGGWPHRVYRRAVWETYAADDPLAVPTIEWWFEFAGHVGKA